MSVLNFLLALPLGLGAGYGINYVLFEGIGVFSKVPNKETLARKKNNVVYVSIFGVLFTYMALLVKDSGIILKEIILSLGYEDSYGLIVILIILGW